MIMALCDRFHKLPSEILAEPVYMLRLITLDAAMRKPAASQGSPERAMTLGEQRDAYLREHGLPPVPTDDDDEEVEIKIDAS